MEFYPGKKPQENIIQKIFGWVGSILMGFVLYLMFIQPWVEYLRFNSAENLRYAIGSLIFWLIILGVPFTILYFKTRGKRSKIIIDNNTLTVFARPIGSDWIIIKQFNLQEIKQITKSYTEEQPFKSHQIFGSSGGFFGASFHLNFINITNESSTVWLPLWNELSIIPVI